jgi:peptidyl-prolyl cis-trans isomerase B (cyclophilin B)
MRVCIKRWVGCVVSVGAAILLGLAGCTKEAAPKPEVQVEAPKDNDGKPIPAVTVSRTKVPLLLPFKDAVILGATPPEGEKPADVTHTGKNAVKIFESIANELWDKANFADDQGRRVRYQAVVATELGDIHIDLHGRLAPNHVRSFVCLAKAGYYDGMAFYYSINRKLQDNTVAYIESGCPRGTGQRGSGSIGYWLRKELSEKLTHDEGVVGACLGEDPDSAACRFYITAAPMPWMDPTFTIFGKVTQGMDIVHRINKKEVDEFDHLQKPVLIRSVTIRTVLD